VIDHGLKANTLRKVGFVFDRVDFVPVMVLEVVTTSLSPLPESEIVPVAPRIQPAAVVCGVLGSRNIRGGREPRGAREQPTLVAIRGELLIRELHFVGSVDAVLAGKAVAPGASCGGGSSRTRLVFSSLRLMLMLLLLLLRAVISLLELPAFIAKEGHCRGHEVLVPELGIVNVNVTVIAIVFVVVLYLGGGFLSLLGLELEFFAIAVFAFRNIKILADQRSAIPEDDKVGRTTPVVVLLADLVAYQMALHAGM